MISLLFIRMLGPGISNLMNMVVAFTVTITFLLTIDVQLKKLGWSLASLLGKVRLVSVLAIAPASHFPPIIGAVETHHTNALMTS